MAYVNFDSEWVLRSHPAAQIQASPEAKLIGYRFDDAIDYTEKPDGFSVPCIVEEVGGQKRIRFENTFRVRFNGGFNAEDTHDEWFGKQSCYFADYLSVSDSPLYPVVEPNIPEMQMR